MLNRKWLQYCRTQVRPLNFPFFQNFHLLLVQRVRTVLPGAEERGVQHCSLVSFLIFLIPADLRSYLCSTGGHESSAMHKFCTQNAKYNHVVPNLFL